MKQECRIIKTNHDYPDFQTGRKNRDKEEHPFNKGKPEIIYRLLV
jgi:hypothetical protein